MSKVQSILNHLDDQQPAAAPARHGWLDLPCLKCGNEDQLYVELHTGAVYCDACDACFTLAELEHTIAAWWQVCEWLRKAPLLPK